MYNFLNYINPKIPNPPTQYSQTNRRTLPQSGLEKFMQNYGGYLGGGSILGAVGALATSTPTMDTGTIQDRYNQLQNLLNEWQHKQYNAGTDVFTRQALGLQDLDYAKANDNAMRDIAQRNLGGVQGLSGAIARAIANTKANNTANVISKGSQMFDARKMSYEQMLNQLINQTGGQLLQANMWNQQQENAKTQQWIDLLSGLGSSILTMAL